MLGVQQERVSIVVQEIFNMRLAIGLGLVASLFGFTAGQAAAHDENRAADDGWDREGAAKYLDDRMDFWFAKAKKLRTGQTETACISCHTTIPYVLARPVLRQAMRVNNATPQESRILEEAKRRVDSYADHEVLYDFSEDKKTQSRGTEAVLNALILASADAGQTQLSAPTQKALQRLWQTQRSDGAWDWLDFGLEPFETIDGAYQGTTLAALAVGVAQGSSRTTPGIEKRIDKLCGYLKAQYPSQRLFNKVWALLASTRLRDLLTDEQRQALIKEIENKQRDDGGWALESLGAWRWNQTATPFRAPGTLDASLLAKSDGYATGLIVYTLRQAGLPVSHPAVSKGLQWLRTNQHEVPVKEHAWRAWRAHSLNFDREHAGDKGEPWRRMFMSDLATGFAALALVGSD
jgi:squalene-hopene/tetraprenyl-beta-curcumene cyclase